MSSDLHRESSGTASGPLGATDLLAPAVARLACALGPPPGDGATGMAALDLLADAYLATDDSGRIQGWNLAAEVVLGTVRMRDMVTDLVADMDVDVVRRLVDKASMEVQTATLHLREAPADGHATVAVAVAAGQESSSGVRLHWLLRPGPPEPATDETARRDRMHAGFVQVLLHDVRSPLTAAVGAANALGNPAATPTHEVRDQMLDILRRSLERIDEVAGRTLALDQVESMLGERDEVVEVVGVVAAVVAGRADERPDLQVMGEAPATVQGDSRLLALAVRHLVDNAYDHTPLGTEVRITVSRADEGVEVVVADAGPGVPAHLRRTIFDLHDRGEAPLVRGGLGIGLAIVRRVAVAHGGYAKVVEPDGGGAAFHFVVRGTGGRTR